MNKSIFIELYQTTLNKNYKSSSFIYKKIFTNKKSSHLLQPTTHLRLFEKKKIFTLHSPLPIFGYLKKKKSSHFTAIAHLRLSCSLIKKKSCASPWIWWGQGRATCLSVPIFSINKENFEKYVILNTLIIYTS